jgi:G:T-mismatch repair DNA endonuclease (very short patch repair protein)
MEKAGWKYLIIWECETKNISSITLENKIKKFMEIED